eukprot:3728931-Rhodomonas_salina.1
MTWTSADNEALRACQTRIRDLPALEIACIGNEMRVCLTLELTSIPSLKMPPSASGYWTDTRTLWLSFGSTFLKFLRTTNTRSVPRLETTVGSTVKTVGGVFGTSTYSKETGCDSRVPAVR